MYTATNLLCVCVKENAGAPKLNPKMYPKFPPAFTSISPVKTNQIVISPTPHHLGKNLDAL